MSARPSRAVAGMTLIEVMASVTILALIAAVILGGFSQTMHNKRRVEEMADRSHVIRVAMERMVSEISQAYVSIQINPNPALQTMNTCFIGGRSGRGHRLDFTSFSHRRLYRDAHESDQNEISYFIADHPEDRDSRVLARREQNRIDEDPQSGGVTQILVEDVLDLEMEYFDHTTGTWVDSWDTRELIQQPNRLPTQVKIFLTVEDEDAPRGRRVYGTRATPMITWALNHAVYNN